MSLLVHGEQEEFLLFIHNFNVNFPTIGAREMDGNIQYLFTIVCRHAMIQFDLFSTDIENTETLNVDCYIKGLALCFSLVNLIPKRKLRCAAE